MTTLARALVLVWPGWGWPECRSSILESVAMVLQLSRGHVQSCVMWWPRAPVIFFAD